jgi:hypothetical protein
MTTEAQPPGVYPGVDFDDYLKWSNVSKHMLDSISRSPAHLRAALAEPRKRTPAMTLGAAVHAAVLEPGKFTQRYTQAPETDKRSKLGKEAHEAAAAGGRVLLKIEELVAISEMLNAINSHPYAGILLNPDDGEAEVSIAWIDEETGVHCKARPDFLNHAHNVCVDLKTCQDSSMGAFTRAIVSYNYHLQSSMYTDGLAANGRDVDFVFVVVETDPPYGIGCYELSPADSELGRTRYKRALRVYQQCVENHTWPGYPEHVRIIELPSYARFSPIS